MLNEGMSERKPHLYACKMRDLEKRRTSPALFRRKGTIPQFLRGTAENVLHNCHHAAGWKESTLQYLRRNTHFELGPVAPETMRWHNSSCRLGITLLPLHIKHGEVRGQQYVPGLGNGQTVHTGWMWGFFDLS